MQAAPDQFWADDPYVDASAVEDALDTDQTPAAVADRRAQRARSLISLSNRLREVRELYDANLRGAGIGSVLEYLPTSANRTFNDAANSLRGDLAGTQGLTASQTNTPAEVEQRFGPFIPSSWDSDTQIEAKLSRLEQYLRDQGGPAPEQPPGALNDFVGGVRDLTAAASGQVASMPPAPAAPTPAEQPTSLTQGLMEPGRGTPQLSTETRTVTDPALARIAPQIGAMITQGRPLGEILSFAQQNGVEPRLIQGSLGSIIQQRNTPNSNVARWIRANPRRPYPVRAEYEAPLSAEERSDAEAASSAPGAYLIGSADALTAGYLPELVGAVGGETEETRGAMNLLAAERPYSTLAGQASGGSLAVLAPELAATRVPTIANLLARAPRLNAARPILSEIGYGAAYGSGHDPENRLRGAAEGALVTTGTSLGTRGAARTIGSAVAPTGGNLRPLYDAGVRPTIGQRFSQSGVGGRVVNTFEQALQSYPILGAAPAAARQAARDEYERGAFNNALREIGRQLPEDMPLGTDPHRFMQESFDEAYTDARRAMQMQPDPQFTTDLGGIQRTVNSLTDNSQNAFQQVVRDSVGRRLASRGGMLRGDDFVQAQSEIGAKIRALRSNPQGDRELADALDELSGALDDAAARHSPAEAVEALANAHRGYAQAVRIEMAAGMRGGGTGRFTPTQYDSAVQRASGGIRSRQYLRGDALGSEYAEAGRALVDTLPNSGTGERLMTGQVIGGAGGGGLLAAGVEPTTLATAGALTLPYLPGARRVVNGTMAPRDIRALIHMRELLRRYERVPATALVAPGVAESQ